MEEFFTTRTGVAVGRLYVNRCIGRPVDDPDMQLLQRALTLTKDQCKQRRNNIISFWAVAIALVGIIYVASQVADARVLFPKEVKHKRESVDLQFDRYMENSHE